MSGDDRLRRWAADTWHSLDAMVDPRTGLAADAVDDRLSAASRSRYTSPTNVGGQLWSTVAARDLGIVDDSECRDRCTRTLASVAALWRHPGTGLFANWYDEADGALLTRLPGSREEFVPFLSSVDNGWLAAGLMVVSAAVPEVRDAAEGVLDGMRLDAFHDAGAGPAGPGGRLRGGFWAGDPGPDQDTVLASPLDDLPPVHQTGHHYDLLDSEPRIASYVGIARGLIPPEHLGALTRGTRTYRGRTLVATFGGSMFEELMPDLLVPEADWSELWRHNHPAAVASHREYALEERGYRTWGFSPCALPGGGYSAFGVQPIAVLPDGYPSEHEGQVVVTPHASALALLHDRDAAEDNLIRIEEELGAYGPGGFLDAVDDRTGQAARRHLALDQSMILAALADVLTGGALRSWFTARGVADTLRPVVAALPAPHPSETAPRD